MLYDIRPYTADCIDIIVSSFAAAHWPKPRSTFEHYLQEQEVGSRIMWVAYDKSQLSGYVTLSWKSLYQPFAQANIPEIMDLNVLPKFRGKGIGAALLQIAENEAYKKSTIVGLGVGLYPDYGAAQKLYVTRGYIPDGFGVTYNYQMVIPGNNYLLDDDLVLWFTKRKP